MKWGRSGGRWSTWSWLGACASVPALLAAWAGCGGTTGHEGEEAPTGADAGFTADATTPRDATLDDADEALFDVAIPYADRALPDVTVPRDAGALDWPACPPDLASDGDGGFTDPAHGYPAFPAQYDDAGRAVPAPDGSACETHVWLGRREWDECVRASEGDTVLPPCAHLSDAGKATAGPGSGQPLLSLCQDLSRCTVRTGCGLHDVNECLCGVGNGGSDACRRVWATGQRPGPCWREELAALQVADTPEGADNALAAFADTVTTGPHAAAGPLNQLYVLGTTSSCFPLADASAD
jgi:hypothetical protein